MASPYTRGTLTASAISSKDIDIVSEQIIIRLSPDAGSAYYIVTYTIKLDSNGRQVPLLFVAKDYAGKFTVTVDGRPTSVISGMFLNNASSYNTIRKFSLVGDANTVTVRWDNNNTNTYRLEDLIYFEADFTAGTHVVQVEYTAVPWSNRMDWVRELNHRYSLTPAKFWRSFGSLDITVSADSINGAITTNLGSGTEHWHFNKLPAEFIEVNYKPHISSTAAALIKIGPEVATLLLVVLHLVLIDRAEKNKLRWISRTVKITGIFLVPIAGMIVYMLAYGFIDGFIGPAASGYHGYYGLIIFLYPIALPVYALVVWLLSKLMKESTPAP